MAFEVAVDPVPIPNNAFIRRTKAWRLGVNERNKFRAGECIIVSSCSCSLDSDPTTATGVEVVLRRLNEVKADGMEPRKVLVRLLVVSGGGLVQT